MHREKNGTEITCSLRDQDLVEELAAVLLDQCLRGRRGVGAPDIVVGNQQPPGAVGADRVLDRSLRKVGPVPVLHELQPMAVLP